MVRQALRIVRDPGGLSKDHYKTNIVNVRIEHVPEELGSSGGVNGFNRARTSQMTMSKLGVPFPGELIQWACSQKDCPGM
jgi:hypothetical protein